MKKCPMCAEEIQDEAKKCKHCGEYLVEKPATAEVPPPAASGPRTEPTITEPAPSREVELFNGHGVVVTSSQVKIQGGNTYAIAHINGVGKRSVDTFAGKKGCLTGCGCFGAMLAAMGLMVGLDSGWLSTLIGGLGVAGAVAESQKPMPVTWALVLTLSSSEAVAWTSSEERTVDQVIRAIESAMKK